MDPNKYQYGPACGNVLTDRRETKIIYKFNIDTTETTEKYYKALGKIRKLLLTQKTTIS